MALLQIKNLSFAYPAGEKILSGISLSIDRGDFVALCGPTGSGKTTLLRLLKPELSPLGTKEGEILFDGRNINELPPAVSAKTGFVQQSPEHQIVTDKVWHEVAFGMESLCFDRSLMSRRMAEVMSYFGISGLFEKNTSELSGGQKQLVSLAAVLAMNPEIIILDEPTSQLDPVAASEFLSTLKKLNDELGITIIITEHRLENVVPLSNKMAVIENGTLTAYGNTADVVSSINPGSAMFPAMPGSVRLWNILGRKGGCPLNVAMGRRMLSDYEKKGDYIPAEEKCASGKEAAVLKDVYFRYSKESPDVLCGTSLTVYENEILCILGANGSGKSTLLYALAGLISPYSGRIEIDGKNIKKYKGGSLWNGCVAMLPQDVSTMFLCNTLEEEFAGAGIGFDSVGYDLSYAAKIHPYDLSGGEQQIAALAIALASKPKILLLDEPTKGLDPSAKQKVCGVLKSLKEKGITAVIVTHDVEFAAVCADRAAMLFRGCITSIGTPHAFFGENIFYTTAINKITSDLSGNIITADDAVRYFGGHADDSD